MPAVPHATQSIEIFFSYSHEDELLRAELEKHLSQVWRRGVARQWHDRQIGAGTEWSGQIDAHLNSAQIILLLISPDFLASRYCYDIEMTRALERHALGEARVIPILLRYVDWRQAPFQVLELLPRNGVPVVAWRDRDKAFMEVAREIRAVVDKLLADDDGERQESPSAPPRRVLRRILLRSAIAIIASLALVYAGVRSRARWYNRAPDRPPPARAVTVAGDDLRRTKLAFAAGSAVAMAGQSSDGEGPIFTRALADLGFDAAQVQELGRDYAQLQSSTRERRWTYTQAESAKSRLLSSVTQRLEASSSPRPAAAVGFGHDVSALMLLLQFWTTADGDVAGTANDRVAALQSSVRGVAVPVSVAERIRTLRANDLGDTGYRHETEQMLDQALQQFDIPQDRRRER